MWHFCHHGDYWRSVKDLCRLSHCFGQEFSHMKSMIALFGPKLEKCKHNSLIDNVLIYSKEMKQSWVGERWQWTVPCFYLLHIREIPRLDNLWTKSSLLMFGFLELKQCEEYKIQKYLQIFWDFKQSSKNAFPTEINQVVRWKKLLDTNYQKLQKSVRFFAY